MFWILIQSSLRRLHNSRTSVPLFPFEDLKIRRDYRDSLVANWYSFEMSTWTEVDVRGTLFYRYYYNVDGHCARRFRFLVTDDHFIYYQEIHDYYDGTVYFNPDVSCSKRTIHAMPLEYELEVGIETDDDPPFNIVVYGNNNQVVMTSLPEVDKHETRLVELRFRVRQQPQTYPIPAPLYEDFQRFVAINDVTLVTSDGQVHANMNLLKMRSPIFRAMFDQETSDEFIHKRVDMTDFPKDAVEAFVKFLATEKLIDPDGAVCDLFKLGDKYDVPSLKSVTTDYLLKNVTEENAGELYEVIEEESPNLARELFIKAYGQKKNNQ